MLGRRQLYPVMENQSRMSFAHSFGPNSSVHQAVTANTEGIAGQNRKG